MGWAWCLAMARYSVWAQQTVTLQTPLVQWGPEAGPVSQAVEGRLTGWAHCVPMMPWLPCGVGWQHLHLLCWQAGGGLNGEGELLALKAAVGSSSSSCGG